MTASSKRRSRGYAWETEIANRLTSHGYFAYRLGGTTTNMPDVVAWHPEDGTGYAIECKSTRDDHAYVPAEQAFRTIRWAKSLNRYDVLPVMSCRFGGPKTAEHHVVAETVHLGGITPLYRISRDGRVVIKKNWNQLYWTDYYKKTATMPWERAD